MILPKNITEQIGTNKNEERRKTHFHCRRCSLLSCSFDLKGMYSMVLMCFFLFKRGGGGGGCGIPGPLPQILRAVSAELGLGGGTSPHLCVCWGRPRRGFLSSPAPVQRDHATVKQNSHLGNRRPGGGARRWAPLWSIIQRVREGSAKTELRSVLCEAPSISLSHSPPCTLSFKGLIDEHSICMDIWPSSVAIATVAMSTRSGMPVIFIYFWAACICIILLDYLIVPGSLCSFSSLYSAENTSHFRHLFIFPFHWTAWRVKIRRSSDFFEDIMIGNMAAAGIQPSIKSRTLLTSRLPSYFPITV